MKFLFEIFPVLIFFIVFKVYGIFPATAAAITASVLLAAWGWFRHSKIEKMVLINLGIIVVFGGATLLLHDETFIKWKPTVLYWLFGVTLLITELGFGKNLIRTMMGSQIELPEPVWARLNWSWVGFFTVMGVLNLYVAYSYSTDTWVDFKLFGGTGLMLVFVLVQALTLSKHVQDKGSS